MRTLSMSLRALSAYKLRTFFAVIGVLFGSAILTTLLNTSEAMILKTRKEIDKLGPHVMTAMAGTLRFDKGASVADSVGVTSFTLSDYNAIRTGIVGIQSITPFIDAIKPVRYNNEQTIATVIATYPEYQVVRTLHIQYGHFFTSVDEKERANVVVLGHSIASTLFGSPENALGKKIRVDKVLLTVIGVAEELGQNPTGARPDDYIYLPLSTYAKKIANIQYITGVYLSLSEDINKQKIASNIAQILRTNHNIYGSKEDDFVIFTADETVKLQNKTLRLVRSLGYLVASISFAIGGLGILSIMILLVRIRIVEIGIRRAIGATKGAIIKQFLYESTLMSIIGGSVGMCIGCLLLIPIYLIGGFPFVYNPFIIIGSLCSSLLVGILAGLYPAWQASSIHILKALKAI
ncbi:MAG: ABC transporter permease [Desulfovibrionaceae bacterium]|nr:ABC transporter permease [Desulfovibrionaceae bacterium]